MALMDTLRDKAKAAPQRVAFPECDNETMMQAAVRVADEGIAEVVMVGNSAELRTLAGERGISLEGVELVDIADEEANAALSERYLAHPDCRYKPKGVARRMARPLEHAMIMQVVGDVDITFAGINCSTGDVITAGQQIVGLADGVATISSIGIFDIPGYEGPAGSLMGFGDAAVCQNPDSEQLATIAISSSETWEALTGVEARCALLSFSTDGSGAGEMVEKVRAARDLANEQRPDLKIDGEFQLDSAIRPEIAAKKVRRESEVAGQANVLICPDINVGNIGVKLVQNFAHANAYGPILQGFKKIVCDCSRSAPADEIVGNVVMSCVRSQALKEA